jgi:hypothetical protein
MLLMGLSTEQHNSFLNPSSQITPGNYDCFFLRITPGHSQQLNHMTLDSETTEELVGILSKRVITSTWEMWVYPENNNNNSIIVYQVCLNTFAYLSEYGQSDCGFSYLETPRYIYEWDF